MCNAATGAAPTVAPGRAPTNEPTPNNGGTDEPTTAGGSASGDGDPVPPPVDPMCVDRMGDNGRDPYADKRGNTCVMYGTKKFCNTLGEVRHSKA